MRKGILAAVAVAVVCGAGALRAEEQQLSTDVGLGVEDAADIESTICAHGTINECGSITQSRCTSWIPTSGSGTVSVGTGVGTTSATVSGSASTACASSTTTFTKLYKDKYVPKKRA